MSQKPCRACGHMVSTEAPSCPRCRIENPTHSWLRRNVVLLLAGIGVAVAAWVMVRGGGEPASEEPVAAAPPTTLYHAGDSADIRSGPGPEHPLAYAAEPGAPLYVYPSDAAWLPVASGEAASDTAGYVRRELARPGPTPDILVMRHGITTREGNRYVVGLARNTSDKMFGYAMIQIVELKNGQMLGVGGIASINNFGPKQIWQWHALLSADSADSYEIFDVNGEVAAPRAGS